MDLKTRERLINAEANALWEKLRLFEPKERIFVLAEITSRVTRKLKSRESTQYYVDFPPEEAPTNPELDLGDRETRAVNVDTLRQLKKKSKE